MSTTKEFDTVLKRLDKDLEKLESVSAHLEKVESFAKDTKEIGNKFNECIQNVALLVEKSTKSLDSFVQENGSKIKELTDSHQQLSGRVKDMEDKVTVLNTKTEALSKEVANHVHQLEKIIMSSIDDAKKENRALSKKMMDMQEKNGKFIIYFMIPVLILLVAIIIGVYIE